MFFAVGQVALNYLVMLCNCMLYHYTILSLPSLLMIELIDDNKERTYCPMHA